MGPTVAEGDVSGDVEGESATVEDIDKANKREYFLRFIPSCQCECHLRLPRLSILISHPAVGYRSPRDQFPSARPRDDNRQSTQQKTSRGSARPLRVKWYCCFGGTPPKFRAGHGGQTPPRTTATRPSACILHLRRLLLHRRGRRYRIPRSPSKRRRCVPRNNRLDLSSLS